MLRLAADADCDFLAPEIIHFSAANLTRDVQYGPHPDPHGPHGPYGPRVLCCYELRAALPDASVAFIFAFSNIS
eukprot:1396484-Rhodomonas_salina.1